MEYKIIPLTITMAFEDTETTVHPTLLWDKDFIILVDCGFTSSLPIIEKELEKHGLTASQITGIVLTHHDHDHMGAAAAFRRLNPNVTIYASAEEAPFISAQEKPLRLCQAEAMQRNLPPEQQAFGEAFCAMLRRVEPVRVDKLLHDGEHFDWCGGCRIIATPGHTPGHISLFMEKDRIAITGDAIALENNIPVIANPQFALDVGQAAASMKKLLSMNADAYFCYHGGIYSAHGEPQRIYKI